MPTLKFKKQTETQKEFNSYARSLRAIGQDLTELYPEELEIRFVDSEILATGLGVTQSSYRQIIQGSVLQKAWDRLRGQVITSRAAAAPLRREHFTRKYTRDDINRLEQIGSAMRTDRGGKPDIYSLGERLRTVGRIVDGCEGTLLQVEKDRNSMKFEYRDRNGKIQRQEYTNLALYKYQQPYYAERGTYIFIDPWKD
jgi:hypothetical protein